MRFEVVGVGSLEVDGDGVARVMADFLPGGADQAKDIVERLTTVAVVSGQVLPGLIGAIEEIRRKGKHEMNRGSSPSEGGQGDGSAELLETAAGVPVDCGPGGGGASDRGEEATDEGEG